ncbi:MAG: GAF domain-containing protein, partial [Longimicrobiales bacterium]
MSSTSSPVVRPRRTSLADRYRVLLEIGHTVTGTLGMEELFRRIYRETSRVLDAAGFYISTYDSGDDVATIVFYADQGVERHVRITYRGSDSEVIRSGQASTFGGDDGVRSLMVLGDDQSEVTRSAVSAPMRYEGRVTGVVSAQSYQRHCYGPEDVELLQGIDDMAAVAIENARKVEELDARRREAMRIEEIGRAVVSSLEPREVLGKVVDAALELVRCDAAAIWFLDDRTATLEAWEGAGSSPDGQSWELTEEAWRRLVRNREPFVVLDRESRSVVPPTMIEEEASQSVLVVPLMVDDEVVGGLSVGSRDANAFSGDLDVLERLASQASVALENARLHASVQALSLTDPLTGIPNRRHLDIHLEREIHAARRGRSLAIVMFDLDNFKQYNDTLGH